MEWNRKFRNWKINWMRTKRSRERRWRRNRNWIRMVSLWGNIERIQKRNRNWRIKRISWLSRWISKKRKGRNWDKDLRNKCMIMRNNTLKTWRLIILTSKRVICRENKKRKNGRRRRRNWLRRKRRQRFKDYNSSLVKKSIYVILWLSN